MLRAVVRGCSSSAQSRLHGPAGRAEPGGSVLLQALDDKAADEEGRAHAASAGRQGVGNDALQQVVLGDEHQAGDGSHKEGQGGCRDGGGQGERGTGTCKSGRNDRRSPCLLPGPAALGLARPGADWAGPARPCGMGRPPAHARRPLIAAPHRAAEGPPKDRAAPYKETNTRPKGRPSTHRS